MSSFEYLKEFVNERLAAAVEEIFAVFEKTISEYEEEINRQRRLLDIAWKPEIKLHRITSVLPQQHVCKEEEDLADQQLCFQERNSSQDQEDPEPPQIKEEQELCTSQEGEQLVVKQETPTDEESDHSEDQTLFLNPVSSQNEAETELPASMCISWLKDKSDGETFEESEANSDHQLFIYNSCVAESQTQAGGNHEGSESTRNAGQKQKKRHHKSHIHTNDAYNPTVHCYAPTDKKSLECDTCGKAFKYRSKLQRHLNIHTGEKPYSCSTCGKRFSVISVLKTHMRIHTGEKPFLCKTCGKTFCEISVLKRHMSIHTGERPYTCTTCRKAFRRNCDLIVHMRTHSGEKPYACKTCGKNFRSNSNLKCHLKTHTGETLYHCSTEVSGGLDPFK